ncbi:uncharacterized protein LOC112172298 isoform X2 [Rosa chinensis]|uniref:uncharacterized protein LOC112172298 isoform X2 n=1 Tax=Rosa chinensis TaxID=74649 RepID=UPI001AD8ED9D|nr:uncharacterized protein LOC112172298 isoform X2 [Rosa chinensis]
MFTVLLFLILLVSLLLQFLNYLLPPPAQSPADSPNIQTPASPSNPKSEHKEVPADSTNIQIPASPSNPKSEHDEVPAASTNIQILASPSNPKSEHEEVPADSPNIQIPASPSTPKLEHEEVPADSTNTQTVLSSLSAPMEHEKVPPAASSSSGSTLEHDVVSHDVFLSFRGEDTRYAFTDHLYHAMRRQGINAFRDTEKLERGHSISPDLLKAIKESRIAVIILSANYATSTWCLEELAQIIECKESTGLKVLPVFYHVEPSEVRKQTGNFHQAFCKHEETFEDNPEKVKKWREALKQVANLSGWTLKERGESEVIQTITTEILNTLNNMCSSDNNDLIGMDARIEKLMSYLDLGSNDVRPVGIAGMGGIGKSTLAKAVFEKIRHQFESSCFINIADVRGKSLVKLQKLLCQNLQLDNHESIQNDSMGINLLRKRLSHKRVLIILDDVDHTSQLEALVAKEDKGKKPCLGPGSRVIITTRDTHKLKEFGLLEDAIYEAEKLTDKEALQLLCQKAFKENHAPDEYRELSNSFVKYCSGLPLALKVLGSHLCTRTVDEWSAELARLDEDPHKDIFSILQLSFDGLKNTEKDIFLDIACFFRGESQYRVRKILESCDFHPGVGISVLVEKHLINVEEDKLWMHDLLQQMGWHIVRQESPEPGKRSRLWLNENSHEYQHSRPWFDEDTRDVVTENLGIYAVQGVYLSVLEKEKIQLKADPFLNMRKLRLLKICNVNLVDVRFEYLSNKLRLLEWHECPLESLPSSFRPDKLVELKLPNSRIETLWNQRLCLEKLILMDLSYCQYLVKTPDFSNFPNLVELTFEGCRKLSDVHPTLWRLKNLMIANLKDCTSLERLPNSISLQSLAILVLSGCSKLDEFPEIVGNRETLAALYLDGTAIRELPTTIGCLSGLIRLNLCACKNLVGLPSFICSLKSLRYLRLSYSSRIDQLPEDIGSLENLEKLDACYTAIRKVPSSIVLLKNLKLLCFHGCRQVPGECSDASLGLQLPKSFAGLSSLETLSLGQCDLAEGAIPDDIGCLSSLKVLRLDENNFVSLPESISQLPNLREIHIPNCSKLQSLPKRLPKDVNVEASGCPLQTNYPNQLNIWLSEEGIRYINCGNSKHASCPLPIPEEQIEEYLPKYLEDEIILQQHLQLRYFHTEIPDWCRHKSSGSSVVAMQVSDPEIIKSLGVALFVVFEIFESGHNFDKSWELQQTLCTFKDDQGLELIYIFKEFEKFLAGTHVLFCYEPLKYFHVAGMLNKASRLEASVSTQRPDLAIKSCGMQLIFQEEAKEFAKKLSEACNPQTDFEFGRHCKELIKAKGKKSSGNIMAPNEAEKISWKFDFNMHQGEHLQLLLSKVYEDFNRDIIYNATYPHCAKLLEWFGDHHLSRGPSVKIPLPPSLSTDGNWIGLALCARFSDHENQTTSIDKVNPEIAELVCHLETENSGFEHLHHYRPTNEELKRLCPTEYIWLSYIPRQGYLDQLNECDLLEASFASESRGLFAEECGLRLVYQHDEQEFKNLCTFMNSFLDKRSERLEEYEAPKKGKHVVESDFNMHPREDLQLLLSVLYKHDEQEFKDLCISMNSLLDKRSGKLEEQEAPKKGKQVLESDFNMHPREVLQSLLSVLYEGPYGREKDFGLFFPHKVVPFWFFHHYAGDVALCDFPLDLSVDQRWVGLELFVMVSSGYTINVESFLDVDLCSNEISTVSTSVMINICLGSDQLVVIHIPRVRFPEQLNQCHGISALFRTTTPDMRVRMCGSRLLYEQDLEDLIRAITVCTLDSQDVIDSLCQHIQQLLGSNLLEEPSDHVVAVETVEQNSVEGETEVGRRNDHSSTEREDLIQERREKVFTSILHNYRSYLQQKHGCIESERIISHSEGYLLDDGDPKPVFATHHLHVMVETRLYGSLSSEDWKQSLESLLQYFKGATLSVKGQMIAVLNPFTPSSVNNFCFPRKELPGWFTQQTRMPRIGLIIDPLVCDNENWMGFAVCATFSVHEHPSAVLDNLATRTFNVMCHLAASDGRCLSPAPVFTITKEKFKWLHLRGFMWLTYIPRTYLAEFREVRDAEARIYNDCPGLMMTRWSIRSLFKQDVKEFNKAIVQCWTSFFDNLDLIRQFVEADENEQSHYSDRGETSTSKILTPKRHVKDFNRDFKYNATYPHCAKLLEWFGDHTRGPSVKIPLPPSLSSDGNWIGLALYARFSDLENQTTSKDKVNPEIVELVCHLETENGSFKHLHHYQPTYEEFKRLCPTEFIWLSYIPRQGYLDQLNECDLLEASFASESRGLFAEVCVLRLVYQHNEQEFKDLCISMNSLLDKRSGKLEEQEAPKKGKQVLEHPEPEIVWGSNAEWNLEICDDPKTRRR